MDKSTLDLVKQLKESLEASQELRKLKGTERRLNDALIYFLKAEGVKTHGNIKRAGEVNSQLAKKFSQGGRESTIFRGTLEEAKKLRAAALNNPEALEEKLEEETAAHALEIELEEEDSQILATSEKKRRGRPKKK